MAPFRLYQQQQLQASIQEVWDFMSSPANLKLITPDYMDFEIISPLDTDTIYPGMMISYRVKPLLGIPMTWVTEITHVKDQSYFVDEQRVGPYVLWHHEHFVEKTQSGVLMTDIVTYKLPLGFLGKLAHKLFIRKQLDGIFNYRKNKLDERYAASHNSGNL